MEAVIFQRLPLPLPHLSLPLPTTKNEKTTVDNFFNFCGFVACLLLHFIILRKQKPSFTAITLPTSLELIVSNYSVISKLVLNVEQCFSIFFVIAEPLMYFRVCHGTPTNKNLEIKNCLQENQIFRYHTSKNN